ncbi:MAG: hypothetical protein KatS3mg119_1769 [Rhodothalassiaceae bacterium]|nr:MAG: hypothetical protein KatS3mg119_1769 [Rhodothalassiaceae bacterium]
MRSMCRGRIGRAGARWLQLAAVILLLAAQGAGRAGAQEVVVKDCPAPPPTLSERINAWVAPVTNAVSAVIFTEIPIPFLEPQPELTGEIRVKPDRLADGDRLTVRFGRERLVLEYDADGRVCTGTKPLPANARSLVIADTIAADLKDRFSAQLAAVTVIPEDGQVRIALTARKGTKPELAVEGAGFAVSAFTDGTVGMPLIVLWLIAGALFFTLRMGFINIRAFRHAIDVARGLYDDPKDPGEVTHFQALTAALSGTVGLGNIAGVAIAISIGGPGATFWMIMAGLFGMSSKFVECTLGVKYREIDENGVVSGGPMYYLQKALALRSAALGRLGRVLAVVFALLMVGAAFGAGNMFQVNQSTAQIVNVIFPALFGPESALNKMPWLVGLLYAVLIGLVVIGGIRAIARVTERLVPLMAFIYLAAAIVILIAHVEAIPDAFAQIVSGAFAPEGVLGGFFGVLIQGIRRASFSNEAGVGSAAIAHSAVKTTEPVSEGMVALLEPFVDTVVICTMSALVIIVTGMYQTAEAADGIALTSAAFESVLPWFPYVLSIAVLMFAYSTSLTYYYYGERAFLFLVGPDRRKAQMGYKIAYLLVLIVGSSMQLTAVMDFADAMLLAMAFPNMIGLYILSGEVRRDLDSYWSRLKANIIRPYVGDEARETA